MSNEFKNPLILAMNLIRYVGDEVSNTNTSDSFDKEVAARALQF